MTTAAAVIRARVGPAPIAVAIVLGTGLGPLADAVRDAVVLPYGDLPGFPQTAVSGHAGRLVVGTVAGQRVAVLQGRAHYYEHGNPREMAGALEALRALDIPTLLLTNSAGSVRAALRPGSLVVIADHINLNGLNPLIGFAADAGFVPMVDAYDPGLRRQLHDAGAAAGLATPEGVYMWFAGPSFETPAEIRMAQTLGADLVGMSTVPEVILGRRLGFQIAAVSAVTNFGAGFLGGAPGHGETKQIAAQAAGDLTRLLQTFLARTAPEPA